MTPWVRHATPWLLLAATLLFGYATRDILLPFLAGLAAAYLLDPLADRLEAKGLARGLAAALIIAMFFGAVIAALVALWPLLQAQIVGLIRVLPDVLETVRDSLQSALNQLSETFDTELREDARGLLAPNLERWLAGTGDVATRLFAGGMALFNLLALLLISPVVAFYLLRDYDRIVAYLETLLPRDRAPLIVSTVREIDRVLSGFVRGQLIVAAFMAVLYAVGWSAIGLKYGLILGLVAGLLAIIPFIGMLFAALIALAVGFGQWGADWVNLGLVAAVWLVVQTLEGMVLTPRLLGKHTGLHPVWVLFAIFAGGEVAGFVGVLLAVPAAAVIKVLLSVTLAQYRLAEAAEGSAS